MKSRVIYHKVYPKFDFDAYTKDENSSNSTDPECDKYEDDDDIISRCFQRALKARYEPVPEYEELKPEFILAAYEYSQTFEADLEMYEDSISVTAHFSFDFGPCLDGMKQVLTLAHDMDIEQGDNGKDVSIILKLYTHRPIFDNDDKK